MNVLTPLDEASIEGEKNIGMRRGVFGALAILVCLGSSISTASAEPFVAGDVLRVAFDTSGIYGSPLVQAPGGVTYTFPRDADVFGVSVLVNSGSGVNTFNVRLLDGDRLLGTASAPAGPVISSPYPTFTHFYFQSASSLLQPFGSVQGYLVEPTIIDFSSFVNGSIDGLLEFTMDAGQIDRRKRFGVELFLGHAVGAREAYGVRIFPRGESPVPEPASVLLMGAGLAALGARIRRRSR